MTRHGAIRAPQQGMQSSLERRALPRQQVYYEIGDRVHPGDLLFQGKQPFLVVSWRNFRKDFTARTARHPYIFFALDPALLKPLEGKRGLYRYRGSLFEKAGAALK